MKEKKIRLVKRNICHSNQVKNPDEIKVRKVYVLHIGGKNFKIMITKIHSPEEGWFEAIYAEGSRIGIKDRFSMADCGIIPYKPNGGRNHFNYLVPVSEEEN